MPEAWSRERRPSRVGREPFVKQVSTDRVWARWAAETQPHKPTAMLRVKAKTACDIMRTTIDLADVESVRRGVGVPHAREKLDKARAALVRAVNAYAESL